MPRIPTDEFPDVQPQGNPEADVRVDTKGANGEQAAQAFRQTMQYADAKVSDILKREIERGNAQAEADALTELQRRHAERLWGTKDKPGFFQTKGRDAAAASQGLGEAFQKDVDEIGQQRLTTPEQRLRYHQQADALLRHSETLVERHVATEAERADEASLDGLRQEALVAVSRKETYRDDGLAQTQQRLWESKMRPLQYSPEQGDALAQRMRSDMLAERIRAALSNHDTAYATELYKTRGDELGPWADTLKQQLAHRTDEASVQAEVRRIWDASQVVDESGKKYPWRNSLAAHAELDKLADDNPLKGQVEELLNRRLGENEADRKRAADEMFSGLMTHYRNPAEGPESDAVKPYLDYFRDERNGAGAYLDRYQAQVRQDAVQERVTATAEDRQLQRELHDSYSARPLEERAKLNLDAEYTGSGISPWTLQQLRAQQKRDLATLGVSDKAVPVFRFEDRVHSEARRLKLPVAVEASFKAYMHDWYVRTEAEQGGKAPTETQVQKATTEALARVPGHFLGMELGSRYRFQAPDAATPTPLNVTPSAATPPAAAPAQPAGKAKVGYRYTEDRKQRAPAYSDGTTGPLEDVHGP